MKNYYNRYILVILITLFLFITNTCSGFAYTVLEIEENILGAYFQLGRYNDEPIVWRCMDIDDENGALLLSDKILCYKAYNAGTDSESMFDHNELGTDIWENSTIRTWLNAKEKGGNITWVKGNVPDENHVSNGEKLAYDKEDGFLSSSNFSESELSVIKTVDQWQILGVRYAQLSTNGVKLCFQTNYYPPPYTSKYGTSNGFMVAGVSKLNHVEGAMYRVSDTIFLLDERQIYRIWENFGTISALSRDGAYESVKDFPDSNDRFNFVNSNLYNGYALRSSTYDIKYVYGDMGYSATIGSYICGIRPAFYLNTDAATIQSGSGTKEDPYIIDGSSEQEGVVVFSQGEQIEFDQEPIEENDRLLVPVRAIFESLGAEVTYDDGDGVITANNGERTVVMQVDNYEMGNGTEVFTLDVAPKLVGDRTMVPLRAVSEAFDCKVEYIENLNRVVIDKPKLPMDFGERPENPNENWQREDFQRNFPGWEPF